MIKMINVAPFSCYQDESESTWFTLSAIKLHNVKIQQIVKKNYFFDSDGKPFANALVPKGWLL